MANQGIPEKDVIIAKAISAIIVTSIILYFIFSGGSKDKPANDDSDILNPTDLHATVNFTGTQFIITNNDNFDYTNAKLQLNKKYQIINYTLRAGERLTVGMLQFADEDGNRFDIIMKPQNFSIWCQLPGDKHGFYYATWQ